MAELGSMDGHDGRSAAEKRALAHVSELYALPPEMDGGDFLHERPVPARDHEGVFGCRGLDE
jgi:hypothetical protein